MNNLTFKQQLFVHQYVASNGNAAGAYQLAYGRSKSVSTVCASRLLRNANVRAYLDQILAQAGAGPEEIAKELKRKINLGSYKHLLLAFKLGGFDIT